MIGTEGFVFTGNNEWYTPSVYLEYARKVLGNIDLDPASNDYAQQQVRAGTYYTIETNGLDKEWKGNVWMNPPYSKKLLPLFVEKFLMEYENDHIDQAILLTNNATDTKWFHSLASVADGLCFTKGRIKFHTAEGELSSPVFGQTFFYYGNQIQRFTEVFSEVGLITQTVTEESIHSERPDLGYIHTDARSS